MMMMYHCQTVLDVLAGLAIKCAEAQLPSANEEKLMFLQLINERLAQNKKASHFHSVVCKEAFSPTLCILPTPSRSHDCKSLSHFIPE